MPRFVCTLALAASIGVAVPAFGQNASLSGTIVDPSGAVLPAVQVMAARVDPTERSTTTVLTDANGAYEFHALPPGSYTVTASLPGFESFRAQLLLSAGDSVERNISLQIGSLQETVTVTTQDGPPEPHRAPAPPVDSPTPPRAPAPGTVRVGGNIKPPTKTYDVRPIYPAALAAQGAEGHVDLTATIGRDGLTRDITIVSSPNDDFSSAASNAVSQWQFTPTLLNGVPVDVHMRVSVNFAK
jgi:TonB family protein